MWGVGGLTWGLMIRYLGVGLGLAIGCGLASAAGTLVPPIFRGQLDNPAANRILGIDVTTLLHQLHSLYGNPAANAALLGVGVSILGIILVGMAGMSKERELPEAEKKKSVAEYDFKRGILVAVFSGLMSAGMGFGLQGGQELEVKAQYGSLSKTHRLGPNDFCGLVPEGSLSKPHPIPTFFQRTKIRQCVTTATPRSLWRPSPRPKSI